MVLDILQAFFSLIPGNFIDIFLYYAPLVAIAITISIFIYNWRIGKNKEKESLENIKEKYIEVYENSDKIKASDFNIAKYNEYYYKHQVNTEISDSLNNGENILIIGKPKAGKTRAAYEAIKRVKGFKIIKFWEDLIKIEELPDNLFEGQKIIFIDDLNKYKGKLDFNRLIKKLNSKSKKYMIFVTCRNGEEYKHCKKEFGEYLKDFKRINLEDIDDNTAQNLSAKLNLKVGDFDGTIGSLFLGIGDMKLRYEGFPKECRVLFTVIKLFAYAGSYIITKKTLEEVYSEKLKKENMHTDILFEEAIKILKENSFIFEESKKVSVYHDTYLDIPEYEVSLDDLKWLKTVLSKIEDENALFNIGNSFNDNRKYKEAINCYDKALEINSKNDKSWNNKGIALAMLNKYTEAIICYDKSLNLNSKNDNAWTNKGISLNELDKIEEAIECYDKALEINPNHEKAWNNKGNAFGDLKRYEEAIECYNKALEINPKYSNAWNSKGTVLAMQDKNEEAIHCYNKSIKINQNGDIPWYNKGIALTSLAKYTKAIECYDKALEINPNHEKAWNSKGKALAMLRKHIAAIKCYDKAIEINSNHEYAWYNKGNSLDDLEGYWDAIESYEKVIEINQKNIEAWYNKGIAFGKLEEYKDSIECFDKVLEINLEHEGAWNNKGNALAMLGKYQESIECYDKVLEINPNHKTAQNNKMLSYQNLEL